jgi:hypothetical protein
MTMITTSKFYYFIFVNPRASLTALIQASVPEFTNLILSTLGTIETAKEEFEFQFRWHTKEVPLLSQLQLVPPAQSMS